MRYRQFGRTGIEVSEQCLGTMMYGSMGNRDHDDCVAQIHRALDSGINILDTADAYSGGESEQIVGRAIADRRDNVILATKAFWPMSRDRNDQGGSRRWLYRAVEASLERLGTDYIDIYQLHRLDESADLDETLGALTDLQRAGKIRWAGTSMFPAERLVEAQWAAERRNLITVRSEQAIYNLFARHIERGVLPTARRYGMGVLTFSPLAGSWLTGRYRSAEDVSDDTRVAQMSRRFGGFDPNDEVNQRRFALIHAVTALADGAGLPVTHLALAWANEHPDVSSVIIGPRTGQQLDDALAAAEVRLDADLLDALDALCPPGTNLESANPTADPTAMQVAYRRRQP